MLGKMPVPFIQWAELDDSQWIYLKVKSVRRYAKKKKKKEPLTFQKNFFSKLKITDNEDQNRKGSRPSYRVRWSFYIMFFHRLITDTLTKS